MKLNFLLFFVFCFFLSCSKNDKNNGRHRSDSTEIFKTSRVQFSENSTAFHLKSGRFEYQFPFSELPYKRAIFLNSSLLGYITQLQLEDKIVGVASPEFIYSSTISNKIKVGTIQNIGNEQHYDVERMIDLKPDVVFTNHIPSFQNTYDILEKQGVKVVFLDEYLEQKPLNKTNYLLIFGSLMGKKNEAKAAIKSITQQYNVLKQKAKLAKQQPKVLANEMYGDLWYLPGGNTTFAHFMKDANAVYILKNDNNEKAVTKSFEEVFDYDKNVDYWLNIGNHKNKKDLMSLMPLYASLPVYNQGKLYSYTAKEKGKSNDYFESGVVRADLVLQDYIKILHPEILKDSALIYMKELK